MYQYREIGDLGKLPFLGNYGALAEFEDYSGKAYSEIFKDTDSVKFSDVIAFVFMCYKIACFRQKVPVSVTLDQFKANADKTVMELFSILISDAVGPVESVEEKKIAENTK